ncbi:hypothetical protein [Endozoicomonas numazuensis]|uniref:Uncharacterized protein n=1 Tax=Endozoicomonas numazuensis TaxID=1137799 RepID=A0A081NH25_9GAMM|nr:hypothetical protein [Endozoicomonas numazuensis]KEQ17748.1 hypothetical protein GZ78_08680 [Endozoicomonas numazuensis]
MKKRAMTIASTAVSILIWPLFAEETVPSPVNLDEGFQHLQSVLGRYEPMQARQFRIVIDKEFKNKPVENEPEILTVSKGEVLIGNPYRMGDAVAFDMIEAIRQTVYEIIKNDQRKKKFLEHRYLAIRYIMRMDDDHQWHFESTILSHSDPRIVESQGLKGSVDWLKSAFELTGITSGTTNTAEGKTLPVAIYAQLKFTCAGDELYIEDRWQDYQMAKGPNGKLLPFPDFRQPVGRSESWYSREASFHE